MTVRHDFVKGVLTQKNLGIHRLKTLRRLLGWGQYVWPSDILALGPYSGCFVELGFSKDPPKVPSQILASISTSSGTGFPEVADKCYRTIFGRITVYTIQM